MLAKASLRDMEMQFFDKVEKLSAAESRLEKKAEELRIVSDERIKAAEESTRLQSLVNESNSSRIELENELKSTRLKLSTLEDQLVTSGDIRKDLEEKDRKLAEARAELETQRCAMISIRKELEEKDASLQRAVHDANALQADHDGCARQISHLKEVVQESERRRSNAEEELKCSADDKLRLEHFQTEMSEKDEKIASLDAQLLDLRVCLEASNRKLREKIQALSIALDSQDSLKEKQNELLCRIEELERAVQNAHQERLEVEENRRQMENELHMVREDLSQVQSKLSETEASRSEAQMELQSLKESERQLAVWNDKLKTDLESNETMLAASGINCLSKTAAIEEFRSVIATTDSNVCSITAELEALRTKHVEVVSKVACLEKLNLEVQEKNDVLSNRMRSLEASLSAYEKRYDDLESSLAASESAKSQLEMQYRLIQQALAEANEQLSLSQADVRQQKDEAFHLRNVFEQARQEESVIHDDEEQIVASKMYETNLLEHDEVSAESKILVLHAETDITILKKAHMRDLKGLDDEFELERSKMTRKHQSVVKRLQSEVEEAVARVKAVEAEKSAVDRELSVVRDRLNMQREHQTQDETGYFKTLMAHIQVLERAKCSFDSDQHAMMEQVALLSEELGREKEHASGLERSRDVAREEARKLRSELKDAQKGHLDDIELMLAELESTTLEEANTAMLRKLQDENNHRVKDLEKSLHWAQMEAEDLRRALEHARQENVERLNLLITSQSTLEKEMNDRLFEKEEEIVAGVIQIKELQTRCEKAEESLDEVHIAREELEDKVVQAESQAADATAEANKFARRLKGLEEDMHAMASEIEMLVESNDLMEDGLMKMKAAHAAAQAEARTQCIAASTQEKITADLKVKLEKQTEENRTLRDEITSLQTTLRQIEAEKENAQVERSCLAQSLDKVNEELKVCKEEVAEKATVLNRSEEELSKANRRLIDAERQVKQSENCLAAFNDELEILHREKESEIRQLQQRVKELNEKCASLDEATQHHQKSVDEKNTALKNKDDDLHRLTDELKNERQELSEVKAAKEEAMSKLTELQRRVESAESLGDELVISQDTVAKLEVTNRILTNRVEELESVSFDLAKAEASLLSAVQSSKELERQVEQKKDEADRLKAHVQVLASTISRMKSDRLLQQDTVQEIEGQATRAGEVKHDREMSLLKSDNDAKARELIELAAKLTARSRLITHSKMIEQALINFIENFMERTHTLLVSVSNHSLKLKLMACNSMGASIEALDLAHVRASKHARVIVSPTSCDELRQIVSQAKRAFEQSKVELQLLKRGTATDEIGHLPTPPPTPKYSALSSNLSKMKSILEHNDEHGDRSTSSSDTSREGTLRDVVNYVELQIDGLLADLFSARRALESKDEAFAELENLVSKQQVETEALHHNLKPMQIYAKQMEGNSVGAVSPRNENGEHGPIDLATQAAMKQAAARIICNALQRGERASAGQALRKWNSNACALKAVEQQRHIAEAMARQLEITREKLAILKSHLKHAAASRREGKSNRQQRE